VSTCWHKSHQCAQAVHTPGTHPHLGHQPARHRSGRTCRSRHRQQQQQRQRLVHGVGLLLVVSWGPAHIQMMEKVCITGQNSDTCVCAKCVCAMQRLLGHQTLMPAERPLGESWLLSTLPSTVFTAIAAAIDSAVTAELQDLPMHNSRGRGPLPQPSRTSHISAARATLTLPPMPYPHSRTPQPNGTTPSCLRKNLEIT
jgi:hypothetical protein